MRILLITDTHLAPDRTAAIANWEAARAYAAQGGVDLTIHLGDITRDGHGAPGELPFAAALGKDWPTALRYIPGNHDIGDNPPGEGQAYKQPLSLDLLATYRSLFGTDRWAIHAGGAEGWLLLGLNAQLFGTGTREETAQWEWLIQAVEDAGGRPLAIFSHKPLFQDRLDAEPPHIRYVPTLPRRRLLDLLKDAGWKLWLSGHTHQFWDRTVEGVRHIWLPSAAYRFPDVMQPKIGEKIVGLGLLTLGARTTARFDLVAPDGLIQVEYNPAA